jgi:ankyrin repeat protein
MELLVESKARIDDPNDAGETPLISSVHRRNLAMVRLLLKAGANPDRKDNSGRSARDYAMLEGASSSLVAEIQANAKPAGQRAGSGKVYGPSFR